MNKRYEVNFHPLLGEIKVKYGNKIITDDRLVSFDYYTKDKISYKLNISNNIFISANKGNVGWNHTRFFDFALKSGVVFSMNENESMSYKSPDCMYVLVNVNSTKIFKPCSDKYKKERKYITLKIPYSQYTGSAGFDVMSSLYELYFEEYEEFYKKNEKYKDDIKLLLNENKENSKYFLTLTDGKISEDVLELKFQQDIDFFKDLYKEFENLKSKQIKESNKKIKDFESTQKSLMSEFDVNNNGEVDVIEGNDFMELLKKHQPKIIQVDKEYIQKLIKASNYLKVKKENIQSIFNEINNLEISHKQNEADYLNDLIGILKNQIHEYEQLVFHSINMVVSIAEDDLITYYEIYESFDKLGIFNSNWENEVSQKFSVIGSEINELMYSVNDMSNKVVGGLNKLTYATQDSFKSLESSVTGQLKGINSKLGYSNLMSTISTYQIYKMNTKTPRLK
jgi:hypothetical protein